MTTTTETISTVPSAVQAAEAIAAEIVAQALAELKQRCPDLLQSELRYVLANAALVAIQGNA